MDRQAAPGVRLPARSGQGLVGGMRCRMGKRKVLGSAVDEVYMCVWGRKTDKDRVGVVVGLT